MTNAKILGLNQRPIETIQAGVLMALYQEFDLIVAENLDKPIDFTVTYAINKTAKQYISSIEKIQEELKAHDVKYCVMNPEGTRPRLNEDNTPMLLEGMTKEDYSKDMMTIMEKPIPFVPHRIQPEAMQGVVINASKSRTQFQIFKEYMIYED